MKRSTTHNLNIEWAKTQGASSCLANGSECLWEQIIEAFTCGVATAQLVGLALELVISESAEVIGKAVNRHHLGAQFGKDAAFSGAQYFVENVCQDLLQNV